MRVREAIQKIQKAGWVYSHTKGSHRHFYHPTIPGIVTVPGADHKELTPGTEADIKRKTGIK